jgi:hypothetical protein
MQICGNRKWGVKQENGPVLKRKPAVVAGFKECEP